MSLINDNVVSIGKKKLFTLAEANSLLPLIMKITEKTLTKVKGLEGDLNFLGMSGRQDRVEEYQKKINTECIRWQEKMQRLGLIVPTWWVVDFDCGFGYYCWRFPEDKVWLMHGYTQGVQHRQEADKFNGANI